MTLAFIPPTRTGIEPEAVRTDLPRINQMSESVFGPKGHGVHTAFLETTQGLRDLGYQVGTNERWRDGILHVHTLGPWPLYRLRTHRGPKVVSAHVTADSLRGSLRGSTLFRKPIEGYLRYFYGSADHVVAVSEAAKAELLDGGVRTPISVIPNGIDRRAFERSADSRGLARADLGVGADEFVVLTVGQVQPRKGVETFLEVARALPHVTFVWVGSVLFGALASARGQLEAQMRSAPPNVRFVGQLDREQVAQWYLAADVFTSTARQETFGLVALEAAAASLPIVLRDITVFRELFGADGALFPSDAAGFAEAVESLRLDPKARATAATNAEQLAHTYGAEVVAQSAADLYRSVLGAPALVRARR
ncbi:glycosyltransferase family 4 protein [Occultella kanbiaonis]|uniref:glycosyltransferase family 4 protein n=1 Tax=Occultella kanbiaonis TaxID=2675754 RepID=UPI0012B789E0|nr:glycosyltransferase family 4 protein [Occultella kanbiaonis]